MPALADKAHPVIGFTVYDMSSFIALPGESGRADGGRRPQRCQAALGLGANMDVNTQISQIQQFINQKVDAIVIAAVNSSTLGPQVEAAKAAGIPVIITNLSLVSMDAVMKNAVSYVGPDDVKAGENEAIHVMDADGDKGGVVVLQGPLGQSGEIDRTKGIKNILAKNPDVKLLAIQPANWKRTEAYSVAQDFLSRYGSLRSSAFIPENDDMAIGAIQALREKGLAGKIPVVGTDGIKDGMRAVLVPAPNSRPTCRTPRWNSAWRCRWRSTRCRARQVPKLAMFIMPQITKDNVAHYYDQLYVSPEKFLDQLPALVVKNLASGDYAFQ